MLNYSLSDLQRNSGNIHTVSSVQRTNAHVVARKVAKARGVRILDTVLDTEVVAEINRGRWVAHCPAPSCNGAEMVDPSLPVFMCLSCFNEGVGSAWLSVVFPENLGDIQDVLLERPLIVNRNWAPTESVDDLELENAAQGINVLDYLADDGEA